MNDRSESVATRESQIVQTFLELADTLVADFDVIDSLTVLAARCVEILDTAATGVLLADTDGRLRMIAASDEQARLLELFQLQNDEGPCMEAFASGRAVVETSLPAAIERWPLFAHYATNAGYESVYAIPLRLRGHTIGVLNLLQSGPDPIGDTDLALAQALADLATIAILQAAAAAEALTRQDQLQHALDSRIIIEQAKGMLAQHADIDMPSAFDHIRASARNTNTKLTDVAARIVDGRLDLNALAPDPSSKR